jgi:hypothetical protein
MKNLILFLMIITGYSISISQNVGIGTLTPASKLHVVSGSVNAEIATFQNAGGIGWTLVGNGSMFSELGVNGTYGFVGTNSPQDFTIRTGGIKRLYLKYATGFVGIGTENPVTTLDVQGSTRISQNMGIGCNSSLARLQLFENSANPLLGYFEGEDGYRKIEVSNGFASSVLGASDAYGFSGSEQATNYALLTDSLPRLFIQHTTGNIGIGNTNPLTKLDVTGSMYLSDHLGIGTSNPLHKLDIQAVQQSEIARFRNTTADNANISVTNGAGLVDFGLNNVGGYVGSVTAGDFMIRTNYTVRMYFNSSTGFVGINNNYPTQCLDVNGNITLAGTIIVESPTNATLLNGWGIYDSAFGTPQYSKDKQGRVLLSGLAEHTPIAGGHIFTLPSGYRPEKSMYFLVASDHPSGFSKMLINHTNGEVSVSSTGSNITWVSFDNITFRGN